MQSHYLLERFVPGDIFHVDTIVYEREILFAIASGYGTPPLEVAHGGGIFTTRILERDSDAARRLLAENQRVLAALGLLRGVSHTEFISGARTAASISWRPRRASAARTSPNWWRPPRASICGPNGPKWRWPAARRRTRRPQPRQDYAGLLVSLARQEHPDTSRVSPIPKSSGACTASITSADRAVPNAARVRELLANYTDRVLRDFHAAVPPREKPTS